MKKIIAVMFLFLTAMFAEVDPLAKIKDSNGQLDVEKMRNYAIELQKFNSVAQKVAQSNRSRYRELFEEAFSQGYTESEKRMLKAIALTRKLIRRECLGKYTQDACTQISNIVIISTLASESLDLDLNKPVTDYSEEQLITYIALGDLYYILLSDYD